MTSGVQGHGNVFERWVRETFFDEYKAPSGTGKWDVSKEANKRHGGVPVSIKCVGYGSSIGLAGALRQFHIEEDFLFIAGFWKKEGDKKRIVNIVAAPVSPTLWRSLWEPVSLDQLQDLDALIKNRANECQQVRAQAQGIKTQPPFTQAQISVNPKIDCKGQRRLQCSLSFSTFFSHIAPNWDKKPVERPTLFGVEALEPILSGSRVLKGRKEPSV